MRRGELVDERFLGMLRRVGIAEGKEAGGGAGGGAGGVGVEKKGAGKTEEGRKEGKGEEGKSIQRTRVNILPLSTTRSVLEFL